MQSFRDFCFENKISYIDAMEIAVDLAYLQLCDTQRREDFEAHATLIMSLDELRHELGE